MAAANKVEDVGKDSLMPLGNSLFPCSCCMCHRKHRRASCRAGTGCHMGCVYSSWKGGNYEVVRGQGRGRGFDSCEEEFVLAIKVSVDGLLTIRFQS